MLGAKQMKGNQVKGKSRIIPLRLMNKLSMIFLLLNRTAFGPSFIFKNEQKACSTFLVNKNLRLREDFSTF